ncbi:MAG: DUF2786 domain-containing protein, partial [Nanoarchaeota archaeon]
MKNDNNENSGNGDKNSTIPAELVSKIKKLLALGTSDNPHEAELALLQAKKLAERYEIDILSLNPFDENKKERERYDRKDINVGQRRSVCQSFVSYILQNHFNVKIIYTGSRYNGRQIVIIGRESDLQIAQYIQDYLNNEMLRLWHKYQKDYNARCELRNSFLTGIYRGLDTKLKEKKDIFADERIEEIKQEKGAEFGQVIENKFTLMKINNEKQLADEVQRHFPKLKHSYS